MSGGWFGEGGGGGLVTQILMRSPKLLKTQFPYVGGGGGVAQLLMQSPKLPKTQFPYVQGGGGGGVPDYVKHLVRIWGELKNCDKNCSLAQTDRIRDSLMGRLKIYKNLIGESKDVENIKLFNEYLHSKDTPISYLSEMYHVLNWRPSRSMCQVDR